MGEKVDFLARQEHFVDHLAPVWRELYRRGRAGRFCVPRPLWDRAVTRGIAPAQIAWRDQVGTEKTLAASIGDAQALIKAGHRVGLLEHGCGLSFNGDPRSTVHNHSGGHGMRDRVELFLMTNEWCARNDREAHPEARVVVCGAPKLDWMAGRSFPRHDPPVVAYATHWDSQTAPETRSAFGWFWQALRPLSEAYRLLGHAHPKASHQVWKTYQALQVEVVRDIEDVFRRADLLVCDCGSAPYEFARTGKPVVVCNAPFYRREVNHGLRFWEDIPGLQCDRREDLLETVALALTDPPEARALREAAMASVYPHFGEATQRAADAVEEWLDAS